MTEPGFMVLTMSRVMSLGAEAPGTSTAPISRSARRTSCVIASRVEKMVLTSGPNCALNLFSTSAELWTGLQADYDLRLVRYEKEKQIERDVEPLADLQPAMA